MSRERIKFVIPANDDSPQQGETIEFEAPKPIILVNIGSDDPHRGDSKGRVGLGNTMASNIGTRCFYADIDTLNKQYPDMEDANYDEKLTRFLSEQGFPDIILGQDIHTIPRDFGRDPSDVTLFSNINESMSRSLLDEEELVSHHLTQEILDEAGLAFDEHYGPLKKPLIGVLIANQDHYSHEDFARKLAAVSKHYPEATIFLCGGRRNPPQFQKATEKILKNKITEQGRSDQVDIISWEFDAEKLKKGAGFNPYQGVIARADHFIVVGNSQSLMSEPLVTGKTVYQWEGYLAANLSTKGYVRSFNKHDAKIALDTKIQEPLNLTASLAKKLIQKYKEKQGAIAKSLRARFKYHKVAETDQGAWRQLLINIRLDPDRVDEIPAHYLQQDEFLEVWADLAPHTMTRHIKKALPITPQFARYYLKFAPQNAQLLPDHIVNNDYVLAPKNSYMWALFEHLPEEKRRDFDFIQAHILDHPEMYYYLSDPMLYEDPDLALLTLMSAKSAFNDRRSANVFEVFKKISPTLKKDPRFCYEVLKIAGNLYSCMPKSIKKRRQFALLSAENTGILTDIHPTFSKDKELILRGIQNNTHRSLITDFAHKSLWRDRDFVKKVVTKCPSIIGVSFFQKKYAEDKELLLLAMESAPRTGGFINKIEVYRWAAPRLKTDPEFVKEILNIVTESATKHEIEEFLYGLINHELPKELRDNEEIMLACAKFTPDIARNCYLYASQRLIKNASFAIKILEHGGKILHRLDEHLFQEPAIIDYLVKKYDSQLKQDELHLGIDSYKAWDLIAAHPDFDNDYLPNHYREHLKEREWEPEMEREGWKTVKEEFSKTAHNLSSSQDFEDKDTDKSPKTKKSNVTPAIILKMK